MGYYIRLDDACEKRNINSWNKIEMLLDKYDIKPLVGVIPNCEDTMMDEYEVDESFWNRVIKWGQKGWIIAVHGYNHVCITNEGGLNPVNRRSEFAGVPLDVQKEKIKRAVAIFKEHEVEPKIFFAPSHTFDENTLEALRTCSNIRCISDTIANKPYNQYGFNFIPQQSGTVRKLPLNTVTFCYHPNTMKAEDFEKLENFIKSNREDFQAYKVINTNRKLNLWDLFLRKLYFLRR